MTNACIKANETPKKEKRNTNLYNFNSCILHTYIVIIETIV